MDDSEQIAELTKEISEKLEFLLRGTTEQAVVGNLTAENISFPKIKIGDDLSSGEENSLKAEAVKA